MTFTARTNPLAAGEVTVATTAWRCELVGEGAVRGDHLPLILLPFDFTRRTGHHALSHPLTSHHPPRER